MRIGRTIQPTPGIYITPFVGHSLVFKSFAGVAACRTRRRRFGLCPHHHCIVHFDHRVGELDFYQPGYSQDAFDRANEVGVRKVMGAEKRTTHQAEFLSGIILLVNFLARDSSLLFLFELHGSSFSTLSGRAIPLSDFMSKESFWLLVVILLTVYLVLCYRAHIRR